MEDTADFGAFFASIYPDLARSLLLLTGDRAEAEDLSQEALARALARWDEVRIMASPRGYVYQTAFNLNRKRLRRLWVRQRHMRQLAGHGVDRTDATERAEVLDALQRLPRPDREALLLVDWLGYSSVEAGELLGIADASVRARIHRARRRLREYMEVPDE